jgi:hypothetical protein
MYRILEFIHLSRDRTHHYTKLSAMKSFVVLCCNVPMFVLQSEYFIRYFNVANLLMGIRFPFLQLESSEHTTMVYYRRDRSAKKSE